jgi:predicted TIM-barrel fold metal-dependent hydrolase
VHDELGTRGERPFDADNHYYEALDAFTRHLDPAHGRRVIEWAEIGGRRYHVIGGKVNHAVVNPTFDPVAQPGVLSEYFRGNPNGDNPLELLKARERIRPAYRDRDARIATLDEQGLDGAWMFPTLGMVYEEALRHDPEAVTLLFSAFNRWVEEDWGFAYQDRIFAAPYITLVDLDWACQELSWALDHDARTIVMRPAAPTTVLGPRSPFDTQFDPFWRQVEQAGITVVVHAGDSGYTSHGYGRDGFSTDFGGAGNGSSPIRMLQLERPIEDFLSALVCERMFERFPNLRVASVENGSKFLRGMFEKLEITNRKMSGLLGADPIATFREHVWINPFWEDDVNEVVDLMGADRVIFGSDWPHIEALPHPLDYLVEVKGFAEADQRKILRENTLELNRRRPA